jgi:hypothetical protein
MCHEKQTMMVTFDPSDVVDGGSQSAHETQSFERSYEVRELVLVNAVD